MNAPDPAPLPARLAHVLVHCRRCSDERTITVGSSHLDEHDEPCPSCDGGVPCEECGSRDDFDSHVLLDGKYQHVRCAAYALIYESDEQDDSDANVARVVGEILKALEREAA